MRLQPPSDDLFDEFPEWVADVRSAVVSDVDALRVAETADLAAQAAVAATLSAGLGAGAVTGGTTMTSAAATATHGSAATIFSGITGKIAAVVIASATVTGGLAATGALPDAAQRAAADLVAPVGIELPRPADIDLAGMLEVVETRSGTVSLGLDGSGLTVVELSELPGWTGTVTSRAEGSLSVTFQNGSELLTVQASVGADGDIATSVVDGTVVDGPVPGDGALDSGLDGSVEGGAGAGVTTGPLELEGTLGIEGTLGLGTS